MELDGNIEESRRVSLLSMDIKVLNEVIRAYRGKYRISVALGST